MDRIIVENIEVEGRHGCADGEEKYTQPFRVDVTVMGDFSSAAKTDSLEDTIDYRTVIETAKRIIGDESVHLLETLVERIATDLLDMQGAQKVRVRVTKLRPPIPDFTGTVGVEIKRGGGGQ